MGTIYKSKKDRWLVTTAVIVLAVCTLGGLQMVIQESGGRLVMGILGLLFVAATLLLFHPIRYELTDQELRIRGGLFRWRIPYDQIDAAAPVRSFLTAPALSIHRLRIDYRYRDRPAFILISPEDREGFLEALAPKATRLIRSDDRLIKRPAPIEPAVPPPAAPPAQWGSAAPPGPPAANPGPKS
jgi:hypothetical protein